MIIKDSIDERLEKLCKAKEEVLKGSYGDINGQREAALTIEELLELFDVDSNEFLISSYEPETLEPNDERPPGAMGERRRMD